jgi:N-ethylmaleimide reductase
MQPDSPLFQPFSLGPLRLSSRIVMAPLTRNRAVDGNVPSPMAPTYYAQRAGAGLQITEATQVCPEGQGYPRTPGIHSAEQVAGWKKVTDAVHAAGGHIFLQLWHVGRISHSSLQPGGQLPVAPSALRPSGSAVTLSGLVPFETPRALVTDELPGIVEQYRTGARNALAAGFDGVEVHGANGYLLDQFLRDSTNQRADAYGGTLENRARLLFEVLDAAISVWGAPRVGVRISPVSRFNDIRDNDPQATFGYVAARASALGLAYLHVLEGEPGADSAQLQPFDYARLRAAFAGPYMANCGYDRSRALAAVAGGAADLIAFGKDFISNPDLVERLKRNAPLNAWDADTFYSGEEKGYIDYPPLPASWAPL